MSDPFAKVVLSSVSDQDIPLVTIHLRYWRGIHSELMTHRAFSRNARSSRAVPVARMLSEVETDPFVPRHWGKNQKGMQAAEEIGLDHRLHAREVWLHARESAVIAAETLMQLGLHKQITNRLLEPFMWIDTLVTATDWANFFALRDHKDAEPHLRDLAQLVKEAIASSTPQSLQPGQWHLPYIGKDEMTWTWETARKVSAARCARISYAPFDGDGSVEKELQRYAQLVESWPVHASPVEHQATPDHLVYPTLEDEAWANPHQHRNFRGWRQFRSMIEHETTPDTQTSDKELFQ
jgi:hypothetical protein